MNRLKDFMEVLRHKRAFMSVRKNNKFLAENISLYRALMHDTEKAILILLVGDRLATKFHRWFAGHHAEAKMNDAQRVEAFCDWECARFTKPSKPLNGFETWRRYYSHVDMAVIIDSFCKSRDLQY